MRRQEIDKPIARISALEAEVATLRTRPIVIVQPQPQPQPQPAPSPYTSPFTSPFTPPWGPTTSQSLASCTAKSGPAPMAWN